MPFERYRKWLIRGIVFVIIIISIIWYNKEEIYLVYMLKEDPIDEKFMYYIKDLDTLPVIAITSVNDKKGLFNYYKTKGGELDIRDRYTQFHGMPTKKTQILKYEKDSLVIIRVTENLPDNINKGNIHAYYVPSFILHDSLP